MRLFFLSIILAASLTNASVVKQLSHLHSASTSQEVVAIEKEKPSISSENQVHSFVMLVAVLAIYVSLVNRYGRAVKHKQSGVIPSKLISRLSGDRDVAKRLLESAKRQHPGKTQQWYCEKVLYDLERDRH